jgi:hypothetical protein
VVKEGRERQATHSEAVDDSADDHLGEMPGDDLQDSTDGVAGQAQGDGLSPAHLVPRSECRNGTKECTQLREDVNGVAEVLVTLFGLTAKQLEVMPEMLAMLVSGKYRLKSAEIKTPEKTPCVQPVSIITSKEHLCAYLVIAEPCHGHYYSMVSLQNFRSYTGHLHSHTGIDDSDANYQRGPSETLTHIGRHF